MSATTEVRKLRAQDLAANAAEQTAGRETLLACNMIRQIPQVSEEQALLVLHALQVQTERSGNMHLENWRVFCDELGALQSWLEEQIQERKAWHT